MKNSIKIFIALFIIFVTSITTSIAAVSTSVNKKVAQDSSLLILDKNDKVQYTFKKGDKIIFTDNLGKYKAEIIGFEGDNLVIKYLNSDKKTKIIPSKLWSIKKFSKKEQNFKNFFTFLGLGGLAGIIGFGTVNTVDNDELGNGITALISLLLLIVLGTALLITWGIFEVISNRKNKRFNLRTLFKAKISS